MVLLVLERRSLHAAASVGYIQEVERECYGSGLCHRIELCSKRNPFHADRDTKLIDSEMLECNFSVDIGDYLRSAAC